MFGFDDDETKFSSKTDAKLFTASNLRSLILTMYGLL
jgi:hypothetical protein